MFMDNQIQGEPAMSIGAVVFKKIVNVNGSDIELNLWDVEEPELVFTSEDSYFSGAKGVVILYDITRRETLAHAVKCCKKCTQQGLIHIPRILVGNKSDLNDRSIGVDEGAALADRIHAVHYDISAISGKNVDEIFLKMASMIQEMSSILHW
jgi:GTPase SAR1 family protein